MISNIHSTEAGTESKLPTFLPKMLKAVKQRKISDPTSRMPLNILLEKAQYRKRVNKLYSMIVKAL